MYSTNDIRKNLKVELDGEPYVVTDFQFVKPGKGNAFTRVKLKSLISGRVLERTWKSGEQIGRPDLEEREMQYLYSDGSTFTFMDTTTYDQVEISRDFLANTVDFLLDNLEVTVLFFNDRPINIELPNFVDLEITLCEPGVKGDTATGANKPATLSTGATVNVPLFINEGETIRIDTRTGEYSGRAK